MDNDGRRTDESRGGFSLNTMPPDAPPEAFDIFRREWETQIGDGFRLPAFTTTTKGDFRVKTRATRVHDAAITDVLSVSPIGTSGAVTEVEDQIRIWVMARGGWTLDDTREHGRHTVAAGSFLLRHVGRPSDFRTAPHTEGKIVVLPADLLRPLIGARSVAGPADSAEVRLLVAHANMVHSTMSELGPAGVRAAHATLIELTKAVARNRLDDVEPRIAPALAGAAKSLADNRLADPELSPAMLARELHVSVRTLQRAFATAGESVMSYVRRRRLEEARLALTPPSGRLSISELAAYWQFSDSSHFIRAFKKQYGQTPTEYGRSNEQSGD
ncbi:helix-turn-helix domain-containing protein [Streptomyces sp. AK02-01A]|uniref:helix-turn-helix domain-containing protein n=1 Tax=Streptomyces sp. AK02-01A TaxID=3028648 RepID=UPI0029A6A6E5|nr:helix-turn-helix domain-containing protein [Streptomyces sp. AK02-01A]MDX3853686.1 helix-turn-helix domain-containing protein [Streptomyces sp. AK02-01A]